MDALAAIETARRSNATELSLAGAGLEMVPEALAELTQLTTLNLNGNQIRELPASLGRLRKLEILCAEDNLLEDLPLTIRCLDSLRMLFLGRNSFSVMPSVIFEVPSLTRLSFEDNRLTAIPPAIRSLTNLEVLFVAGNRLSSLPHQLLYLENLKNLFVDRNHLSVRLAKLAQRGHDGLIRLVSGGSRPPAVSSDRVAEIVAALSEPGETAIFCGAGISFHSGLPLANSFIEHMFSHLPIPAGEKRFLLERNLPFELFLEIISRESDIAGLLSVFSYGFPNATHMLVARLVASGRVNLVYTTNFDELLEGAMRLEGLAEGEDFVVIHRTTDLLRFSPDDKRARLVKIHGSAHDPESVAITLRSIASRENVAGRKIALDYLLSVGPHNTILILGYSCSDIFDICPAIESLGSHTKRVVLIDHRNSPADAVTIEPLASKKDRNPFSGFPQDSKRYYCNTDALIRSVWDKLSPVGYRFIQMTLWPSDWKRSVTKWCREQLNDVYLHYLIGMLFAEVQERSLAIRQLEQALANARRYRHAIWEGACLVALSNQYFSLGDKAAVQRLKKEALAGAGTLHYRALEPLFIPDHLLNPAANDETTDGAAHEDRSDKEAMIRRLGNRGLDLFHRGEFAQALASHEQALALAEEIGDIESMATQNGNIARVHSSLKNPAESEWYASEALALARKIDNKEVEQTQLGHLANVRYSVGNYQGALEMFRASYAVAAQISHKSGMAYSLRGIADTWHQLGMMGRAREFYAQAIELFRSMDDVRNQGLTIGNMGLALYNHAEFAEARDALSDAIRLLENILPETHPKMKLFRRALALL